MHVTGTASASSLPLVTTRHLIPGDQLFPNSSISPDAVVFMAEDREHCTRFRIHVHKIILFLFAIKPSICGSPYLRRMGGWPTGGGWCDEADGLYWGFIAGHQTALLLNPRMAQAARGLEWISGERRAWIERAAVGLRNRVTAGV